MLCCCGDVTLGILLICSTVAEREALVILALLFVTRQKKLRRGFSDGGEA